MSIKLLRESSETPNITNKDDVVMVRYAYGGLNGAVQKFENELSSSVNGSVFTIKSGRFVLDGWEIDIVSPGWSLDLSSISSGTYYYTIYFELNAETETAAVKFIFDLLSNPEIDPGDDLTQVQNGTARYVLYTFSINNGTISDVVKKFNLIPNINNVIEGTTPVEVSNRLLNNLIYAGEVSIFGYKVNLEIPVNYGKVILISLVSKISGNECSFLLHVTSNVTSYSNLSRFASSTSISNNDINCLTMIACFNDSFNLFFYDLEQNYVDVQDTFDVYYKEII